MVEFESISGAVEGDVAATDAGGSGESVRSGKQTGADDWAARLVILLVACATDTEASELCSAGRGHDRVCAARQICMYLLHTWFGLTYKNVGKIFGRDRTTVAHACRQIEAHRDRIGVDRRITSLESLLELVTWKRGPAS